MSEKITFRISPAVAAYVRAGLSSADKLAGLDAAPALSRSDQVTLLFCLMRDGDERVKESASAAFAALPEDLLLGCLVLPDIHPAILDAISRLHHGKPAVVTALLRRTELSSQARAFLGKMAVNQPPPAEDENGPHPADADDAVTEDSDDPTCQPAPSGEQPEEDISDDHPPEDENEANQVEAVEEDKEHLSKHKLIQMMGIGEKIKMALTGDKEWRSILVNDTNKLVSSSVIKNPRITDGEILRIIKVGVQNDEIIRLICDNKEWIKNPLIRKALVECPKTPLPNALRYLATLGEKEIAAYAKSRNISSVISTQAKRIVLAKKR